MDAGTRPAPADARTAPQRADARGEAATDTDTAAAAVVDGPPQPVRDGALSAGPVETGGPAPTCRFAFCESFESYPDGVAPPRPLWSANGDVTVDATRAARGTKALRVRNLRTGEWFARTTRPFPALGNAHYGRVFFWIQSSPQYPKNANQVLFHWTLVEASEQADGRGKVLRWGGIQTKPEDNHFKFNIETHGRGEVTQGDPKATHIVNGRWHCIEWSFDVAKNEARFWWNGRAEEHLWWPQAGSADPKYKDPRWTFPVMKSIKFGFAEYQPVDAPWDVWIDEIALDDERIGCGP